MQTNGSLTKNGGNEYFSVPGHTPVIFSEVGGRTLYRLLARDAGGETEGVLLNETVPRYDQFFRGEGGSGQTNREDIFNDKFFEIFLE